MDGGGACISTPKTKPFKPLIILKGVPTPITNAVPINVKPKDVPITNDNPNAVPIKFIESDIYKSLTHHDFFIEIYNEIKKEGGFEYDVESSSSSYMTNNGAMKRLKFDFNRVLKIYDAIGCGVGERMRKLYDLLKPKFVDWPTFYCKIKEFVVQFVDRISLEANKDKI